MQCSANAQIIDLTIDEAINDHAMIIDLPDSDDETTSIATLTETVKDEPMDISIDAGHDGSRSGSGSNENEENNNEGAEQDFIQDDAVYMTDCE